MPYSLVPRDVLRFISESQEPSFSFPDIFKFGPSLGALSTSSNERSGLELSEDEKNIYVKASLPGLSEDEIDVSLERGVLQIKGERTSEVDDKSKRYYRRAQSSFWYQVAIPSHIDEQQEPTTHYENGVLELTLKKAKPSQTKKIKVKTTKKSK